jgi:hypothetical protein
VHAALAEKYPLVLENPRKFCKFAKFACRGFPPVQVERA